MTRFGCHSTTCDASRRFGCTPDAQRGSPVRVESRMGAVAWGQWPAPRFPSPLIEPDVRSYRIRLSDWLHREAHDAAASGRRSRRSKPSFS